MRLPVALILLSALDIKSYRKSPSDQFLAGKAKLPLEEIQRVLKEFQESGMIEWTDTHCGISAGNENMRLSWKIFSLNKKAYEEILQLYTKFFNDH